MSDHERPDVELVRDADLQRIRSTYKGYEEQGRHALWDLANPGFRQLATERDAALDARIAEGVAGRARPRLLDLGCGSGSLAVRLHGRLPDLEVTGIDILPSVIEEARRAAPWASFRVGSADDLTDPDGSFDVVTAVTLISSVSAPGLEEAIAKEIDRVLRPDGFLTWYDIRVRNPWNPAVHAVSRRRLEELFPGWTMDLRSITVPAPIARRLGWTTHVLYPVLHAIPPLRSHLIGVLRPPANVGVRASNLDRRFDLGDDGFVAADRRVEHLPTIRITRNPLCASWRATEGDRRAPSTRHRATC